MSTSHSLRTLVGVGVAVGLAAGVVAALVSGGSRSPSTAAEGQTSGPIPAQTPSPAPAEVGASPVESASTDDMMAGFQFDELSLTNQRGEAIDQSVLDGRTTAVAFFFTSCQGPCPALTAVMKRVQDATAGSDLRLLSVSVDGDNDTPDVIRAYGQGVGADFTRWTFATGNPAAVDAIARAALSFSIARPEGQTVPGPRGNAVPNIIHPTRILLVGPDRRVQAVYAYNDPAQVDQLIARFDG